MMLSLRLGGLVAWTCVLQACAQAPITSPSNAQATTAIVAQQVTPCVQVLQNQQNLAHIPNLTVHVVDEAGIFSKQERERLIQSLWQYERETGSELVVLSVSDLHSESMFDYAHRAACTYRVGRKGIGDGVMLVLAPNQHQMYLYVMRDVEPYLNHTQAQAIVTGMATQFRQNQGFYRGVDEGMGQVMTLLRGRFPPPAPSVAQ